MIPLPSPFGRSLRLQTRLFLYSASLILLLMTLVILLVEKRLSETIEGEARKRGLAIARSLAGVSTNALVTYNYVVLEQNAEKAAQEEDLLYVIIHDKEDKVAAYSGRSERQGTLLSDRVSQEALKATSPFVQPDLYGPSAMPILDIAIPVYIRDSREKWGTVRVGLSLDRMARQIRRTRFNLFLLGGLALGLGLLGSIIYSRRITQPLSRLVVRTISASRGELDPGIELRTGDEIEELGRNFNHMIRQILLHRTELEDRLREITALQAYTDNILSSMTNGLITVDLENRIVTANDRAGQILALSPQELPGLSLETVLGGRHPLSRMLSDTLAHHQSILHSEVSLAREDGEAWLSAGTSLLTDGNQTVIGALVVFQDITGIKALEERLRQADRLAALGTLSAGLAHEIKNPLSAIKTFVQLLPQRLASPTFLEKFNITVPREIDRINLLVEDLLELTRQRKRPFVTLSVNRLLLQVLDLHGEEMARKKIVLDNRLDPALPSMNGNPDALYRAFSNVVINSIQAMPEGGRLAVFSGFENAVPFPIRITFQDTGTGMDEETLKNLFNPFYTTKDKGSGLGLALTHKIVEDHHGTIDVTSFKGKGSAFVLRFPVAQNENCS
jgi:PAS domain S-box-containing protein